MKFNVKELVAVDVYTVLAKWLATNPPVALPLWDGTTDHAVCIYKIYIKLP
jgi:hypothetical protein